MSPTTPPDDESTPDNGSTLPDDSSVSERGHQETTEEDNQRPADSEPVPPAGAIDETAGTETTPSDADSSNTLMNAAIGAVVTFVTTFFVPLAPILGGAVAGYLDGGDTNDGLKIGAISGGIALIPLLVVIPFVLFFFLFDPVAGLVVLLFGLFVLAFLLAYTVGLSALGGVLGVYLHDEFN